ncbi:MAG: archaellin/type IV pilin N-terminal domain-containing protein [Nitrososphaeria archaeon]
MRAACARSRGSFSRRRAISPILATIILIIITVVAGVMLYGFVTGFFSSSATSMSANVEAQLVIPAGASQATYAVTIRNAGTVSITGAKLALYSPSGGLIVSYTWNLSPPLAPGQEATLTMTGSAASASLGSATGPKSGFGLNSTAIVAGQSYNYVIVISFANGASKTITGSITATSF